MKLLAVCENSKCIKALESVCRELNLEFKGEVQSNYKIENKLTLNDIKDSTAILFVTEDRVEDIIDIERFIDKEYYEVEPKYVLNDAKSVIGEIMSDLN